MRRRARPAAVALCLVGLVAAACGGGGGSTEKRDSAEQEAETPYAGYESELYGGDTNWLCKPGLADDVCSRDLDATAVAADGTTEVEPHEAAADPSIDCFYVYPTTSFDEGLNSDLVPGENAEIHTVYNQAARFNSVCRVFAPVYRQATLSAIGRRGETGPDGVDPREIAYGDVLDAFKQYVANESDGRGFVLIGHSQGAAVLNRLIAEEIDDEPALRDRLVSALLLGWNLAVPEGEIVGGAFQNVPLCEADDETACAVAFVSFRSTAPPPETSFFGRVADQEGVDQEGMAAACVDPTDLGGGSDPLEPYFLLDQNGGLLGAEAEPFADPAGAEALATPWVTYPNFVEAKCVSEGGFSYLALTVNGDPADPRTDDITGDLTPDWGMHLVDVNVSIGNLIALVRSQAEAYAA